MPCGSKGWTRGKRRPKVHPRLNRLPKVQVSKVQGSVSATTKFTLYSVLSDPKTFTAQYTTCPKFIVQFPPPC
eukprot:2067538-Rhodomonas_salina.1